MDITSVGNLGLNSIYKTTSSSQVSKNRGAAFNDLFDAALSMVKETNTYINSAEEAEIAYALGLTDNTHDLQVAQQKANLALQYTVAIRNGILDAYKEIMSLQF